MAGKASVIKEFWGLESPLGVHIPTPEELIQICVPTGSRYNMGVAYPPESPVFWIKFGLSIVWGELEAQTAAHQELQRLNSPIYAPAIYYACKLGEMEHGQDSFNTSHFSYIVMDYVSGKTAKDHLEDTDKNDLVSKERIYRCVAAAVTALWNLPIPPGLPPAAIDGGLIRHSLFDDQEAPRHYQTVDQLEMHLNVFLEKTKRKHRVQNLSREPLVFCYSDVWLQNFIIGDGDDSRVTVVDFSDTSILPSSFAKFVLEGTAEKIGRDISDWVSVPITEGVDNTMALLAAAFPMIQGPGSFAAMGRRLPGGED